MANALVPENLTVGKGRLYFDMLQGGSTNRGERYLGNTPGFTLSVTEDAIEKWGSSDGKLYLVERMVTRQAYDGTVVCDEISKENMATWFGSVVSTVSVPSTTVVISEVLTVSPGLSYQIGSTDDNPIGARFIRNVELKIGGTTLVIEDNAVVDGDAGRINILADAEDIDDNTALTVRYTNFAYKRDDLVNPRRLEGALRFISANPFGPRTDLFFPHVAIEPDGSFDWKSDDWSKMQFTMHAIKDVGRQIFYGARATKTT